MPKKKSPPKKQKYGAKLKGSSKGKKRKKNFENEQNSITRPKLRENSQYSYRYEPETISNP